MPKAIISNKIYLDTTPELTEKLVKALTYRIKKPPRPGLTKFSMYDIVKNYKIISPKVIAIPVGREELIPEGYEVFDKRTVNDHPFPNPTKPLREDQVQVYKETEGSCFINAMVGWGKTFTALYIAMKLEQKTLIVCHNTVLRDQWIEEARNLFNMDIGIIGSGKFDIDHSIVVGNIQTLTKVINDISKEFGTVIVDEAHHCPASTFSDFINGMYAKNKIGLSGTMSRKDGKQVLFKDFFGPKLFQPAVAGTLIPRVHIMQTGITLTPGEVWVKKVNNLLYDPTYQQFIANVAKVQMQQGHKVLVVADRVEFLINVGALIGEKCVCLIGETEDRGKIGEQIISGEKDCVVGSRQIVSEGWSVNPLSCVILATPISAPAGADANLEQIIGRIQRMYPGKLPPVVIDMNFAGFADRKQNKERFEFYTRKGWEITK